MNGKTLSNQAARQDENLKLLSSIKLWRAACNAFIVYGACVVSPVFAQSASVNWMREEVQQRVLSRNLGAVHSASREQARNDPRSVFRPEIVGGTTAGPMDNPFQVALLVKSFPDNGRALFCGGTLIRSNVVVTAAHCGDPAQAGQFQVLTDTRRLDGTGVRRDVLRITHHPKYDSSNNDYDVAMWHLSTDVAGISFPTLATDDGPVGASLLVTGWGALSEGGVGSVNLQRLEIPLVDRANCNDSNSYNGQITDRMLCAGFDAGVRDSCQGDSGGPLTRGVNNSVLTGIVSWGTGCARPNLFGIYTRVSDRAIRDFIEKSIGDGQSQPSIDPVLSISPVLHLLLGAP